MHYYRNRTIYLLIFMLLIFAAIFFLSYFAMNRGKTVFGLGIPYENIIVMLLSFASIAKVVYEIYRVETAEAFEKRMKK